MKKRSILCIIGSLVLMPAVLQASPPDTLWVRTYGGAGNDIAYSVCPCRDGGYLIVGYTSSFGSGPQSAYAVRIGENGDTLWTRAYGGASWDGAHYVLETADTCYLVAGYTESFGAGGKDMYLLKLDRNGDTVWTRTFGANLQDCAYVLCPADNGNYLVAGYRDGPSGWTKGDLWLLEMTENGDTLWSRSYGGAGEDYGISMCRTADGNYIIAGAKSFQSAGGKDVWLLKVNASGDTVWTRSYGGAQEDVGYGVTATADSGFAIAGYINGTGQWTAGDLWLIKTDMNGDSSWSRIYGSPGEDFGKVIYETPDRGFIIAGQTEFGSGMRDVWLLRMDAGGDTAWTRTYGGNANDAGLGSCRSGDGGYVIAGYAFSFGSGNADFYVIRTGIDTGISYGHGTYFKSAPCRASIIAGPLPGSGNGSCAVYDLSGQKIDSRDPGPGVYFIVAGAGEMRMVIKVR